MPKLSSPFLWAEESFLLAGLTILPSLDYNEEIYIQEQDFMVCAWLPVHYIALDCSFIEIQKAEHLYTHLRKALSSAH